jgi:hypothetical protein
MQVIDNQYLVTLLRNARAAECDLSSVALAPLFELLDSIYAWAVTRRRPAGDKSRVSHP